MALGGWFVKLAYLLAVVFIDLAAKIKDVKCFCVPGSSKDVENTGQQANSSKEYTRELQHYNLNHT